MARNAYYAGIKHKPLFLINGHAIPGNCNVKYGYSELTEQLVKTQRNSAGVVVAKQVGRRLVKLDGLEWPYMKLSDYEWLQDRIAEFYCWITYYDARRGRTIKRKFYWGDFSGEPYEFDRSGSILKPTSYINVKVNLIDCGESDRSP